MAKISLIEEQGLRIMNVRASIEATGKASREDQEFLLSFRSDDASIEDLLFWLVVDAGVKLSQIICGIKCRNGQSGQPRRMALQLARHGSRQAVMA